MSAESDARTLAGLREYRARVDPRHVSLRLDEFELLLRIADERDQLRRDAFEVRPRGTVTDAAALAKAWDEGFTLATRNNPNQPHPLARSNPYRGEARS